MSLFGIKDSKLEPKECRWQDRWPFKEFISLVFGLHGQCSELTSGSALRDHSSGLKDHLGFKDYLGHMGPLHARQMFYPLLRPLKELWILVFEFLNIFTYPVLNSCYQAYSFILKLKKKKKSRGSFSRLFALLHPISVPLEHFAYPVENKKGRRPK